MPTVGVELTLCLHYAPNMQKIIAFSLLFAALPAAAVVCKTVGPDGSVTYSDIPADACPNEVQLPKSSTYQPVPLSGSGSGTAAQDQEAADGPFTGYVSAAISQPANNATVRSEEGRVPVSLDLQPALQQGHRVRWTLDGIQIQPPFESPSAVLTGVERGSHILTAHVLNEAGVVLRGTAPVRFTLRKTSILGDEAGDGEARSKDPVRVIQQDE